MTTEKLQEILQSDEQLKLDDVKEIIYELKNDCLGQSYNEDLWKSGFYNGEGNAFYICLDLLDKVDPHFIGIEERVAKLEAIEERRLIQERVYALFANMHYGKCGGKEVDYDYYRAKLNAIFGHGTYADTDTVKGDGYGIQITIYDEGVTGDE